MDVEKKIGKRELHEVVQHHGPSQPVSRSVGRSVSNFSFGLKNGFCGIIEFLFLDLALVCGIVLIFP